MQPFRTLCSVAIPFAEPNLDTDQILPARYLSRPRAAGYGEAFLNNRRFAPDGSVRPDSVVDAPAHRGARILVGGANFGCGSSREGAVYALQDFGIGAVLAPSFADIFAGNAAKNGLLCVVLAEADIAWLTGLLLGAPGTSLVVDLVAQTVAAPDGTTIAFRIDPFRRRCLLEGTDELGITLTLAAQIAAFEQGGVPAGVPGIPVPAVSIHTSKENEHANRKESAAAG